jgi:hypothetical protein
MRLLAELPQGEPDRVRSERVRMRCRDHLAQQRARASRARASFPRIQAADVLQPLIVVLGVAYLTEVVSDALRLYRLFMD